MSLATNQTDGKAQGEDRPNTVFARIDFDSGSWVKEAGVDMLMQARIQEDRNALEKEEDETFGSYFANRSLERVTMKRAERQRRRVRLSRARRSKISTDETFSAPDDAPSKTSTVELDYGAEDVH